MGKWDNKGLKIKQEVFAMSVKQEEQQIQILSTSAKKYNPDAISCNWIILPSNYQIQVLSQIAKEMPHDMLWQRHQFFLLPPQIKATMFGL